MCGRYMMTSPHEAVRRLFGTEGFPNFPPRYNVAPTQDAPVVVRNKAGGRTLVLMRWGLVPWWSKGPAGKPMFNARSESAATTPSFRDSFRERRCLVPANGYFEWRATEHGRQPFLFAPKDRSLTAFAGLWDRWREAKDSPAVHSFTILTTAASDLVRPLHDRMPVILSPADWPQWLGQEPANDDALHALLHPGGDEAWQMLAVSQRVNSFQNDDPSVIEPVDAATGAPLVRPV